MRVLESRRESDLAFEPLRREAGGELGVQHLHDDLASEPRVVGDEHARHAPAPELTLKNVCRA